MSKCVMTSGVKQSVSSRMAGFTLVEIMVALIIGLFLIAGMVQVYVANRQTVRFSDGNARIQENARYALEKMAEDLRMAGAYGCSRGNELVNGLPCQTEGIEGVDGGDDSQSDTITIRGTIGRGLVVDSSSRADTLNVRGGITEIEELIGFEQDEDEDEDEEDDERPPNFALVASCTNADVFYVTDVVAGPFDDTSTIQLYDGTDETLSVSYDQSAEFFRWREVDYFIKQGDGGIMPGLYFEENECGGSSQQRELVEGVVNMQIGYGEDLDGDGAANRYVTWDNVINNQNIVSVRVNLLLASVENGLVDAPQQIPFENFDGVDGNDVFNADDLRLYQVVTSTFDVRNR